MERPGVQNSLDLSQRQQIAYSQKCAPTRPKTRHMFRRRRIAEIRKRIALGSPVSGSQRATPALARAIEPATHVCA
jgi:hypothetical protein